MNTTELELEKINNLLDFIYLEVSEMEQSTKTDFIKASIEIAVEKIQKLKKEEYNYSAAKAKAECISKIYEQ